MIAAKMVFVRFFVGEGRTNYRGSGAAPVNMFLTCRRRRNFIYLFVYLCIFLCAWA